ncbi:hypothetical protein AYI68_g1877 [Smittium mucronatum]|uniref:DSBA-like thioredoxin domain-containing protein n=1 Tax=Smittium mucronatum TaxID=133383 RepID=A0A1R0H483_9FUNG|nr:hypothetical protein AYI68_g1877 [Smittium mucronatum]
MPRVICYLEFNSPYSFLAAVRLYQLHNKSPQDVHQPQRVFNYPSDDVCHPVFSKVEIIPRPIEFGIVLKNSGQNTIPITPGSGRAIYMWKDLNSSLERMGIVSKEIRPDASWFPQKVNIPNRIFYLLHNKDLLISSSEELSDLTKTNVLIDQTWRETKNEFSGSTATDALTSEYIFRIFSKIFIENKKVSDETVLKEVLDPLFKKHKVDKFLDSSTIIEMAKLTKSAKQSVFYSTNEAIEKKLFGVPTFVTEDEHLFWGNDHMIDAAVCEYEYNVKFVSKI